MKTDEQPDRVPLPTSSLLCRWYAARKAANLAARAADGARFVPDATGHTEMPLCEMRPGDLGHVLSLRPEAEARAHLLELGFTPGTEVSVVRVAPLGDPLTVRLRGYHLSLRRREAEAVVMRRCPPGFVSPEAGGPEGELP